jgi:hypothetical protein
MAVPHRNNVTARTAPGPDDDNHSVAEKAGADLANFAIVEAVVVTVSPENTFSASTAKSSPSMRKGPRPLGGIEGRLHAYLRNYINEV